MSRGERKPCPLCGNPEIELARHAERDAFNIECRRCGRFTVSGTLYAIRTIPAELRPGLSAYTRENTETQGGAPEMLTTGNVESLAQPYLQARPLEKLTKLLAALVRRSGHLGARTTFDPEWDYPLAYATNAEEAAYHRDALAGRRLIEAAGDNSVRVTHEGWEQILGGHTKKRTARPRAKPNPTRRRSGSTRAAEYDAFLCHASEDKTDVVEPLAQALEQRGLKVWYDRWELKVGDSLRRKIDEGLAKSRFGVVVISKAFLRKKPWTERELDGLVQKEVAGRSVILPVWHKVAREDVAQYSLTLADKLAASTERGIPALADELEAAIRPQGRNPAWPRASEHELVEILGFVTSPSLDVRADAARQLLNLSFKKVFTHHEAFLATLDRLLRDPEPGVRVEGLRILASAIVRTEPVSKRAIVDRYLRELLRLAQEDPNFDVRAQTMVAIGQTVDPRFIESLLAFVCEWDDDTYSKVAPVVALNGLASMGLAKMLRDQIRRALELAVKEEHKKRLRDCLNSINQLMS